MGRKLTLLVLVSLLCVQPAWAQTASTVKTWVGRAAEMESHLKSADVARMDEIGTGVTRPRRAHLSPDVPFESFAWKVLPPGRRNGHWESYKSEIAAYELDKLLKLDMVPPAVERQVGSDVGAAVMWVDGTRSVKQIGGSMPPGPDWDRPLRRLKLFDNLIGNPDRNAGNILLGAPGDLVLIDHSRAFVNDPALPQKFDRVDAELWDRMKALTRENLKNALGAWIDDDAIGAMLRRRDRMIQTIDKLVAAKGRAAVIIP